MATRVFITGVSGYIGGQITTDLSQQHPELQLVGLVRNLEQAQKVKAKLPSVETVLGDLSSIDILQKEAKKADIVIQAADADNIPCIPVLIQGLAEGKKGGSYIQISGAANIIESPHGYGQSSTRVWDDIKDIQEITTFDSSHMHWEGDQTVIREGKAAGVPKAIISPTMVYGVGEGPIKTTSMTLPWLEAAIIKRGKGFTVGPGKNSWAGVHVKDVAAAAILLLEDALGSGPRKASWGAEGYFFAASDQFAFAEIVPKMVEVLKRKGLINDAELDQLSEEEATAVHPYAMLIWGANSRCRASRLRALGWEPTQPNLLEGISSFVAV